MGRWCHRQSWRNDGRRYITPLDDVIKWKHFPRNWPFVRGIYRSPMNFPHEGQWRGALMFYLICAWINDRVNNGEAGDLRRYHAHYDVTVMFALCFGIMRYLIFGGENSNPYTVVCFISEIKRELYIAEFTADHLSRTYHHQKLQTQENALVEISMYSGTPRTQFDFCSCFVDYFNFIDFTVSSAG